MLHDRRRIRNGTEREKPRTKVGQVRQAWPYTKELFEAGHSLKDIRAWLNEIGIDIGYARRKQGEEVFPIWAPYTADTRGFHTRKNTRAVKAGLRFRPYEQTARDTLTWYKSQGEGGRTRLAGPSAEKEAELLAAWKQAAREFHSEPRH
jgi:hypothetical protein